MILVLTIFQYFVAATVDAMDKVLISSRKIFPFQYAFFTAVTGVIVAVAWPWAYAHLPSSAVVLSLLSGAYFCLVLYVFFRALSQGEVSRVVPFIFGMVPIFDVLLSWITGKNLLTVPEFAAMCLLVPGALLITYKKGKFFGKHIGLKLFSAFLWSSYFLFWQFAARTVEAGGTQGTLNAFMWNRVGAALLFVALLVLPAARKNVFAHQHIKSKSKTSALFIFKQLVGGGNFILLSWLLTVGKIPLINGLQGFRYVFLFLIGVFLTKKYRHLLEEDVDKHTIRQKIFALALIALGTLILFIP